jgi:hypothetical protein
MSTAAPAGPGGEPTPDLSAGTRIEYKWTAKQTFTAMIIKSAANRGRTWNHYWEVAWVVDGKVTTKTRKHFLLLDDESFANGTWRLSVALPAQAEIQDDTRMALGGASANKASPSSAAGMKRKSAEPTMKGKAKKEESSEDESR